MTAAKDIPAAGHPGHRDVTLRNGTRWLVTPDGKWLVHPAELKRWRLP